MKDESRLVELIGPPEQASIFFDVVDRAGFASMADLGRLIGFSKAQISRWRHQAELIPDEAFRRLRIFTSVTVVEEAKWNTARVVRDALGRIDRRLRTAGFPTSEIAEFLSHLPRIAASIHKEHYHHSLPAELRYREDVVLSLETVTVDATAFLLPDEGDELLTEESIRRHLVHPANLAAVELFRTWDQARGRFAEVVRRALETVLAASETRPRSVIETRIAEHAIHLRTRIEGGDATDLLAFANKAQDPFIKRAYFNATLANDDVDRVIYHIDREDDLGRALVEFERVHYRDAPVDQKGNYGLSAQGASQAIDAMSGAILKARSPTRMDIQRAKLLKLLDRTGHPKRCRTDTTNFSILCRRLRDTPTTTSLDQRLRSRLASL